MKVERLTEEVEDFTGEIWFLPETKTLIDVGTGSSWKKISELEEIDNVLITHSHRDHVDNLEKLLEQFSPDVYAKDPDNLDVEAEKISDGGLLELDGFKIKVIHTPGHKDDSVCFYLGSEKILFAGDLIFPDGGFGRTDLDEGDRDTLIDSIKKISELDVKRMYTGHGKAVTENANQQIEKSLQEARKHESKY